MRIGHRLQDACVAVCLLASSACGSAGNPEGAAGAGTGGGGGAPGAAGAPNTGAGASGVSGGAGTLADGGTNSMAGSAGSTSTSDGGSPGTAGASADGADSAGGVSGAASGSGGMAAASGAAGAAGNGSAGASTGGNVVSLFDGKTLSGWLPSTGKGVGNAPALWDVQDEALHCTGTVRGTLISAKDYGSFRLMFDVRQLPFSGTDHHYASALIWGTRPPPNDAIGGLQFGVPNGYHWDYRPGYPGAGTAYFVQTSAGISRTEWERCEILAKMSTGVARMACCQLGTAATCKAKLVLTFTDPKAGKVGPIAFQAHSPGAHDEYKNVTIEENPSVDDLITTL